MTINDAYMWDCMTACGGEIRVKPCRYGGGWMALGTATTQFDKEQKWQDLTCGDNDYFDAKDYFTRSEDYFLVDNEETPNKAYLECVKQMSNHCARVLSKSRAH